MMCPPDMFLSARIIDRETGEVDPELSAQLDVKERETLFGNPEIDSRKFPLLLRIRGASSDINYANDELEDVIAELERAASLFEAGSIVRPFLGSFHSVCCLAFFRGKSVVFSDARSVAA